MGCASPQNAGVPNIPPNHLQRLLQVAQITHPLNVNKKYEHLSKIDETREVGQGYRKTYAYNALTTREEIEAKRKQFWQTRVNGQPHIWDVVKRAVLAPNCICQISIEQAGLQMLNQHKITLLNNSIQMCVDNKFNKYEVPVFCINEPVSYSLAKIEDKNLNMEYEEKNLQITIRSTKYPNGDIKLSEQSSTQIEVIKATIRAMKQLPAETKIRLFYSGRELKDDKTLGNYSYQTGTVIQAMIL